MQFLPLRALSGLAVLSCLVSFYSCDALEGNQSSQEGALVFSLDSPAFTKAGMPDSSAYILSVAASDGKIVYEGTYGSAPQSMSVPSGVYTVSIRSGEFNPPEFDSPVYGDDQVVKVPEGESVCVRLSCTLVNCGVQLKIDSSFLTGQERGSLVLRSPDGSIMYGYAEDRVAYFNPGDVSLVMSSAGVDKVLMTRNLGPREILRLRVSSKTGNGKEESPGITVSTDTSAVWLDDSYIIGAPSILDVSGARKMTGAEGVWVYGYIVGCASPFLGTSKDTNLAIAGRTAATDKSECLSVELAKGALRDALNLLSHPGYLGRKVFLKGDIETYYGMPGIKRITEWSLDTPPEI